MPPNETEDGGSAASAVFSSSIGHLRQFNIGSDWSIFKTQLKQYFIVNKINDDNTKRALLINCCGEESYRLLSNLCVPKEPTEVKFADLIKHFDKHFLPPKLYFPERYKFYNAVKNESESIQEWASRVRCLGAKCNFQTELEVALRDRFIMGLGKGPILDRIFEEDVGTLKFDTAVEIAVSKDAARHRYELDPGISVKQEVMEMASSEVFNLSQRQQYRFPPREKPSTSSQRDPSRRPPAYPQQERSDYRTTAGAGQGARSRQHNVCNCCGKPNHDASKCRYLHYFCRICGIKGHLANVCNRKTSRGGGSRHNYLDSVFVGEKSDSSESESMFNIKSGVPSSKYKQNSANGLDIVYGDKPLLVDVTINNKMHKFELDTGASVSVISATYKNKHFPQLELRKDNKNLYNYDGNKIVPLGYLTVEVKYNDQCCYLNLYIIQNGGPPLLGRDFFSRFNLSLYRLEAKDSDIVSQIIREFPSVFSNKLGLYNKATIQLKLKDGYSSKFCKPRPLPFAIKSKVEAEIDRLVNLKILVPVQFSDWGTPIVPVIKNNGTVRLCADYKITANPALEPDLFPLPRIEELFVKLQGGQEYTKLDLSQAYAQIGLDRTSREITTISTHKGLFQYTRLPFGLSCAPSKFQRIMEMVLQGLEGTVCFLDDILVTGNDRRQHLERVRKVLSRLKECGLTIERKKCNFFEKAVNYLGFRIDADGLHPCEDKILDIKNAPVPSDCKQLQSVLGLINYYCKFIPDRSALLHPLNTLLKSGVPFVWSKRCDEVFTKVKNILSSDMVLAHYNPQVPIKLTVDASNYGVAAVLTHVYNSGEEKPIAFASRSLTEAQKKYSQLEKEGLAIIFGVNRFHQYLYGHKFTLVTDHKPLLTIFGNKKGLPTLAANRLQRWALILCNYDYNIEYVQSSHNNADCLSRLPVKEEFREPEGSRTYFYYIFENKDLPINSDTVREETLKDEELSKILQCVKLGWPSKVPGDLKRYSCFKAQLSVENDCILFGYRVVIPKALRSSILKELHRSHLGMVKTKSLARSYVWWPDMNSDIEQLIISCNICLKFRDSPPLSKLIPWEIPDNIWERVHIDFLGPIFGKQILIIVDALSKWVEAFIMPNITARSTVNVLRNTFSRFGFPKVLVSDNAKTFVSNEFRQFLTNNGVMFKTSPPFHPATNGQAENFVKSVKRAISKSIAGDMSGDINLALNRFLLDYRNAAHCSTNVSPANLMFGRKLRNRLDLLFPDGKKIEKHKISDVLQKRQEVQCRNFRGVRTKLFTIGDMVAVRDYRSVKPTWILASIKKVLGPRTYLVFVPEIKATWKRHINQILDYAGNFLPETKTERHNDKGVENMDQVDDFQLGKTDGGSERKKCIGDKPSGVSASMLSESEDNENSIASSRPRRNVRKPTRLTYEPF